MLSFFLDLFPKRCSWSAIKVIIKCANKILHWQIVRYITFLLFLPLCTHTVKCLHTERLLQLKLTRKGGKTRILPADDNLCKELWSLHWSSNKWLQKYHLTFLPAAFGGNKIDAEGLGCRPRKWINKSLNSWKSDWKQMLSRGSVLRKWNKSKSVWKKKVGNLHMAMNDERQKTMKSLYRTHSLLIFLEMNSTTLPCWFQSHHKHYSTFQIFVFEVLVPQFRFI